MDQARCVSCNKTFTMEELKGATCCPGCGSKHIPADPAKDVEIKINVHELHCLGVWAENYAVTVDNRNLDNAGHESLKELVNVIMNRVRDQLKAKGLDAPLTLSQEFSMVEKQYPGSQLIRDGKEEV